MLRLGILGAASIVERAIVRPAASVEGLAIAGLASSDEARARRAVEAFGMARAYPDYAALLADPSVDAVYVALYNAAHAEWALRAVEAGKHVLVEKPICLTGADVEALQRAAAATRVVVREGIMTIHHPWQAAVRGLVHSGELGRLLRVETELTFPTPDPRSYRCCPELGGGILWDAGSYGIQAVQAILGPLAPRGLRGESDFDGPNGIDSRFRAELELPEGIVAAISCAFSERVIAEFRLVFEDGTVQHSQFLRPALAPFRVNVHVNARSTGARRVLSFPPEGYYVQQLRNFVSAVRQGPDPRHLEECRERIGLLEALYADARRRRAAS